MTTTPRIDLEAYNLALDLAVAEHYAGRRPEQRERQLAIWAERERRALLREIAY